MDFSFNNLVKLFRESKKSQNKFFQEIGISTATMRTCDPKGRGSKPMLEQMQKVANHYGKSVLSLYDLSELDAEYIVENWDQIFNLLTPNEIESNAKVLNEESLVSPYVGNAAANPMGKENPIDLEYDLGEYGQHDMQVMKRFFDPNGIWVMVEGDSMEPTLHNGEYVYVSPNRQIEPGKIGFFRINDKTLIKRLYRVEGSNNIILKSDNPKYKPIIITKHVDFQQSGLIVQAARILE